MEAWKAEVINLWKTRRIQIAEVILDGIRKNPYLPVKAYSLDDLLQMVDGATAIITEEFEERGTEIWDTYFDTVWPGILAQGQPLSALVGQITMNAILVFNDLVSNASPENRDQIATYITNWYVKYNAGIVKVGLSCGATS